MKKKIGIILFLLFFVFSLTGCDELLSMAGIGKNEVEHYKLFPTQNMWTFLKLDTASGEIWQVQYSVKGEDYRFETVLSDIDIPEKYGQKRKVGRFTLYPTLNSYNFVMLDQIDGYTYQVQWSIDSENRFVIPITK